MTGPEERSGSAGRSGDLRKLDVSQFIHVCGYCDWRGMTDEPNCPSPACGRPFGMPDEEEGRAEAA